MSQKSIAAETYDAVEAALRRSIADTAKRIGIEPQFLADEIDRALQAEAEARLSLRDNGDKEDLVEYAWRDTLSRHAPMLTSQTVRELIDDVLQNIYRAVVNSQVTRH